MEVNLVTEVNQKYVRIALLIRFLKLQEIAYQELKLLIDCSTIHNELGGGEHRRDHVRFQASTETLSLPMSRVHLAHHVKLVVFALFKKAVLANLFDGHSDSHFINSGFCLKLIIGFKN